MPTGYAGGKPQVLKKAMKYSMKKFLLSNSWHKVLRNTFLCENISLVHFDKSTGPFNIFTTNLEQSSKNKQVLFFALQNFESNYFLIQYYITPLRGVMSLNHQKKKGFSWYRFVMVLYKYKRFAEEVFIFFYVLGKNEFFLILIFRLGSYYCPEIRKSF